ncbi:fatty acyl-AMP ligase [Paenibacillus sp. HWE-109]|uniref:fatty acyl-AMP ligase n=1 Tax=Paenibacillus sp. HWE-109 TaxID=1306526 RepID=UPI001EDF8475|nr:fatty acyl-AMP ligase [Paenibacillus sp. HWE-109]UKS26669.1 fatty acyl-AMP ligase [Paenibacillus sp. HWE-109]
MGIGFMKDTVHTNLVDLLQFRALLTPDLKMYTYLVDGEHEEVSMTAAELNQRAMAIASALHGRGRTSKTALLLYPTGLEFIAGFMGCLYAGIIPIPAYPPHMRRPTPRLDAIIRSARTEIALSTAKLIADVMPNVSEDSLLSGMDFMATDTLNDSHKFFCLPCKADDIAFLQYTSGSTADPKGVMVSHGNLIHNMSLIAKYFQLSEQTRIVNWLPAYHDMGLIGQLLMALHVGCELIYMSPVSFMQKPVRWLEAISRYRATYSGGPNFAYELCAEKFNAETDGDIDLTSWQLAFNGAEPVREETLHTFIRTFTPYGFQAKSLVPSYGLAEGTLYVSGYKREQTYTTLWLDAESLERDLAVVVTKESLYARAVVGCGILVPEQRTVIVHPQKGKLCGELMIGEIWVSGPSVAQGYWGNPEATQLTFQGTLASCEGERFLRTGDLGFIHDNELYITGRIKDVMIVGGRNIYPQDLEYTVQNCHPAVRKEYIAAFQIDDKCHPKMAAGSSGEIVIVAELNREFRHRGPKEESADHRSMILQRDVLAAARQAVWEQYELPLKDLVLIRTGTIPKTSSGKIQRRLTKQGYEADTLQRG